MPMRLRVIGAVFTLNQDADLTLSYAHLSYTGYGINSMQYIDSVEITHSRIEFSGGGIYLYESYDSTSTRVITDNVISVGGGNEALNVSVCCQSDAPIPNLSRNVITNTQGAGSMLLMHVKVQ